jgi:putative transposase
LAELAGLCKRVLLPGAESCWRSVEKTGGAQLIDTRQLVQAIETEMHEKVGGPPTDHVHHPDRSSLASALRQDPNHPICPKSLSREMRRRDSGYGTSVDGEQRGGRRSTVGSIGREAQGYPSDLRDAEWARLEPLIPKPLPGGRPRETDMRAAMNAILYLLRTGCPRHYLPHDDFPPRSTLYNIFRKFQRNGVWEAIWAELHMALRDRMGPGDQPLGDGS